MGMTESELGRRRRRAARGAVFVIVLTLASGSAGAEQPTGTWIDGSERACIPLEEHEAATPLPAGCPALVAGVLLTVEEEQRRAARTNRLAAENAELWLQLAAERARHDATRRDCILGLRDGAGELFACRDQLHAAVAPSPWPDRFAGAGVGGGLVGLTWLLLEVLR